MKEVLSIEIGESESSKFWLSVLNSLKNRGVRDILTICADGLTGHIRGNTSSISADRIILEMYSTHGKKYDEARFGE